AHAYSQAAMTAPVFSLASVVLALATLHATVLTVVLARRLRATHARTLLTLLSGTIALLLADMTLRFSGITSPWPVVAALLGTGWFAVPPLFFEHVRALLRERSGAEPVDAVHAIPIAMQMLLVVTWPLVGDPAGRGFAWTSFFTLYVAQAVAYGIATAMLMRRYAARYRREGAGADDDRLRRLHHYGAWFGVYAAAILVNYGVYLATGTVLAWLDYLVPLALAALVACFAYERLRATLITLPRLALPDDEPETEDAPSVDLQRHADTLRTVMERDRPYLDPTLRLSDLAARVGVGERTLSDVLSSVLGATFYDLVNGYRVQEAQARLRDPATAHLTVLAVGMEAGFSSKASFNRVFKARTGETPSAYRKRARADAATSAMSGDGQGGGGRGGDGQGDGLPRSEDVALEWAQRAG
ncbi:MAG: helix-turn-helix transcriptional regulator, partial [Bacteroidota bacterium]